MSKSKRSTAKKFAVRRARNKRNRDRVTFDIETRPGPSMMVNGGVVGIVTDLAFGGVPLCPITGLPESIFSGGEGSDT